MFIFSSKKAKELKIENKKLKNIIKELYDFIDELENKLSNEMEIAYNYHFPQHPTKIIVSKYVANKFLKNKTTFVPQYPFPKYQYKELDIVVSENLEGLRVLFEAEWKEPPIICKNCGSKKRYEHSYPSDNPKFCSDTCFNEYVEK